MSHFTADVCMSVWSVRSSGIA